MLASGSLPNSALGSPKRAKVVYLDQNMWIDLAWAVKAPQDHARNREVLELLCEKVEAGEVRLPLTASNLYETHKVTDPEQRALYAYTQATLSRSEVFRGRRRRLEIEIGRVLCGIYDLPWTEPEGDWVFSDIFFESQTELGDTNLPIISDHALALIRANPSAALFHYLVHLDEATRRQAVAQFEQGCEDLRGDMELRRAQHSQESLSLRRRIYSVLLVLGDQEIMIAIAEKLGLPWRCFAENNGATMRKVISETPTFLIEREMALKLEGQNRAIHVNDMRDMRNFTAVLPYADIVVAEKQFSNLARQAGLTRCFDIQLETKLQSLLRLL
jgi:hypothetical protein